MPTEKKHQPHDDGWGDDIRPVLNAGCLLPVLLFLLVVILAVS